MDKKDTVSRKALIDWTEGRSGVFGYADAMADLKAFMQSIPTESEGEAEQEPITSETAVQCDECGGTGVIFIGSHVTCHKCKGKRIIPGIKDGRDTDG